MHIRAGAFTRGVVQPAGLAGLLMAACLMNGCGREPAAPPEAEPPVTATPTEPAPPPGEVQPAPMPEPEPAPETPPSRP
jgi:hypothetical protein